MQAPVTACWAALLGLLYLGLAARVIRERRRRRIDMGTGGDVLVERYVRAHANFNEYVPFSLILLLLVELANSPEWLLHSLGIAILTSRIFHAWSFSAQELRLTSRTIGVVMTQATMLLMIIILLGSLILS